MEKAINKHYREACAKVVADFYPELEFKSKSSDGISSEPLKEAMAYVGRWLRSRDPSYLPHVDDIFGLVKRDIQNLSDPEIIVTDLEDSDISGDESESTLIGKASPLSTPDTLSPASADDERSFFSTKGEKRRSFLPSFSKSKKTSSDVNSTPVMTSTGVSSDSKGKLKFPKFFKNRAKS